jgi:glutamate-ammonia-ligase adenylyltransferase
VLPEALLYSHYVARLIERHPDWSHRLDSELGEPFARSAMELVLAGDFPGQPALHEALRELRQRVLLRVIGRDLLGRADLEEVVSTITALAEITLSVALDHHTRWLTQTLGTPLGADGEEQSLIVVGMGKLGGGELNVSSDIDLIFAFPEDGRTTGPKVVSNQEFFDQLGRRLIAAIGAATDDGFVFRVDMRLRPYGDPGPLSCSFAFLEQYLLTQGREWERYAWLKGRALTGNRARELEDLVRPFVFRKYLDYDAYSSMRDLHKQIRAEVKRRDLYNDVKLGPGGIREIEFIAQVFQLVRGGRDRPLQAKSTREALRLIGQRRLLPPPVVGRAAGCATTSCAGSNTGFSIATISRRRRCPKRTESQEALARTMNAGSYAEFVERLERHRLRVTEHFESIFADTQHGRRRSAVRAHMARRRGGGRSGGGARGGRSSKRRRAASSASANAREPGGFASCRRPAGPFRPAGSAVPARACGTDADSVVTAIRLLELLETISRPQRVPSRC